MARSTIPFGAAVALLALAAPTPAQSFNIDVGSDPAGLFGTPAATYGAAAAQPGVWNSLTDGAPGVNIPPPTANPWYVATLNDLAGAPTAVTTSVAVSATTNSVGDFEFNNAGTTGDDEALLDDCEDVGGVNFTATWTFSNLSSGSYDVYIYSWAPDSSTFRTSIAAGNSSSTTQVVGGAWTGAHVLGVTYALHRITVTTGTMTVTGTTTSGFGSFNGFQLKKRNTGTTFCWGDGSGTACPCGNNGTIGNGCANSVVAAGANLLAFGDASVTSDTLVLQGTGMPNANCLYFQGTTPTNSGNGNPFGDGKRCAGGTVIRLGTKLNASGASQYPEGGDLAISVRGLCNFGDVRHYQVWYRNAAAFCTADTFNLSNGVTITWQ